MSAATLTTVQALAKTCLAANTAFAGLTILLELEEGASPAELAALEKAFETALLRQGLAVIVLSPELVGLDNATAAGLSAEMSVLVAICENPEVNRGAADPLSDPPRIPSGKSARLLLQSAVTALLPEFRFPPQVAGRPQWESGFWAYYLVAHKRHVLRASS